MRTLDVWRTPWWRDSNHFSYGLLAYELADADYSDGLPQRLIDRLGVNALGKLANGQAPNGADPSPLSQLWGYEPAEEVQAAIAAFNESHHLRYVSDYAATVRAALAADASKRDVMLATTTAPQFWLREYTAHDGATKYAHGYKDQAIHERVAIEVYELTATRPKIRKCCLCGAAFVPHRAEPNCRWNVYPALAKPGDEPLRPCVPDEQLAAFFADQDAGAHKRERKRRYQRVLREAKRDKNGARHLRAKKEYEDWLEKHRKRKGPPPRSHHNVDVVGTRTD